jgi:deaminated glutathione amidase
MRSALGPSEARPFRTLSSPSAGAELGPARGCHARGQGVLRGGAAGFVPAKRIFSRGARGFRAQARAADRNWQLQPTLTACINSSICALCGPPPKPYTRHRRWLENADAMLKQATNKMRAALVQMCTGRDLDRNLRDARELIREAAGRGAEYVQTPEVTSLMEMERARLFAVLEVEEGNHAVGFFAELALELKIWLHIGSMPILLANGKIANRSYLFAPTGDIVARFDKIHMFDVALPNGETYRESKNYEAGSQGVLATLPWGVLALTVCYDLRFPNLYRALAKAGADFLAIPSAFTRPTGEAHWTVLLRARAIENGCFVLAAAQAGKHESGRETYGHSLIVSPWGEVLAEGGVHTSVIVADLNCAEVREARQRIPSLQHDRPFQVAPLAMAETKQSS